MKKIQNKKEMVKKTFGLSIYIVVVLMAFLPSSLFAQIGVWPGDVDNNGIVNHYDLLFLGRACGYHGPVRTDTSLVFNEHQASIWNYTLPGSSQTNIAFADCDGNGVVNAEDTLVILRNYGLKHGPTRIDSFSTGTSEDPALYFATDDTDFLKGQQFDLHVTLGAPSLPVDDFYGIAFSYYYDTTIVKKSLVTATLDNRWIANAGINDTMVIFMQRNVPDSARIDIAVSQRYYAGSTAMGRNISGYGNVAKISLVIEDNLIGKTNAIYKLGIGAQNVKMVDMDLNTLPVNAKTDTVTVNTFTRIASMHAKDSKVTVYPNPASGIVNIDMGDMVAKEIELYDIAGSKVSAISPSKSGVIGIDIHTLQAGLYIARIVTSEGVISKKVSVK